MARTLDSEEAARRLGVKMATLYAYVSRGRLRSYSASDGRRSLFDADEVEALARGRGTDRRGGGPWLTITTGITQLREDGPSYRGRPATALARTVGFEAAAEVLWAETETVADRWVPPKLPVGPGRCLADQLRGVVVSAGATDPLRSDLRPASVRRAARSLIAALAVAVESRDGRPPGGPEASIAERLAGGLGARDPRPGAPALDAALVLLADHELATSTLAVRVAASTRADLYDAVLAGLGTLGGPLHGGASQLALGLVLDAERLGPERALDDALRWQGVLPGFGHAVYVGADPRVAVLLEHIRALASPDQWALLGAMTELAAARDLPAPNVDLALAALTWVTGMPADAGVTLFTVARVAGWTAHYLEELTERPLRFRARAVYASPADVGSASGPDDQGARSSAEGDGRPH